MVWQIQQELIATHLSPEAARFVRQVLARLEAENVFDAPGVISSVLSQMRAADSDAIRSAVARTERVLKQAFALGMRRIGL